MNGIEIEIDNLGRVLIPIKIRRKLGIKFKSRMTMLLADGNIILSPIEPTCALCGCKMEQEKKIQLCDSCIAKVKAGS